MTQYAFSAEQQERLLMSSAATRTMNSGVLAIMGWTITAEKSRIT